MIDRAKFFPPVRQRFFGGVLRQSQVDGMNAILNEWEVRYPAGDPRWLAYILATVIWETAHTMQPIDEYGGNEYFRRMYDIEGDNPALARQLGNIYPGDGALFHGRGYNMNTGRRNYQRMSAVVGVDLVSNPDRAKEPAIAAAILFEGMEHGDFTGAGLPRYFNATTENWNGARAIINGDADADHNGIADSVDIGTLGKGFFAILKEAA